VFQNDWKHRGTENAEEGDFRDPWLCAFALNCPFGLRLLDVISFFLYFLQLNPFIVRGIQNDDIAPGRVMEVAEFGLASQLEKVGRTFKTIHFILEAGVFCFEFGYFLLQRRDGKAEPSQFIRFIDVFI
jgi:hypothetical protein